MALYEGKDHIAMFFREKTVARLFAICTFLGVLWLFRSLWPAFFVFVLFERSFDWTARRVVRHTGMPRNLALTVLLLGFLGVLALFTFLGYERIAELIGTAIDRMPEWLRELRSQPLLRKMERIFHDSDMVAEQLQSYATQAFGVASAIGRFFIQATIGFLLAVVYLFEAESLSRFGAAIAPKSLFARIVRWLTHVADAVSVMVQLQLVVALFNTITTLPVLVALGVPHIPQLMLLVFVSALIPVIGNLVAGAILCMFAYQARGWGGVAIFLGVTALLGKVESYYLSPRLTAKHVKMPSFMLAASLVAFEHLFGFAGFFLSFPFLFVAGRIRAEFREEEGLLPPRSIRADITLHDEEPVPTVTMPDGSPAVPQAAARVPVREPERLVTQRSQVERRITQRSEPARDTLQSNEHDTQRSEPAEKQPPR